MRRLTFPVHAGKKVLKYNIQNGTRNFFPGLADILQIFFGFGNGLIDFIQNDTQSIPFVRQFPAAGLRRLTDGEQFSTFRSAGTHNILCDLLRDRQNLLVAAQIITFDLRGQQLKAIAESVQYRMNRFCQAGNQKIPCHKWILGKSWLLLPGRLKIQFTGKCIKPIQIALLNGVKAVLLNTGNPAADRAAEQVIRKMIDIIEEQGNIFSIYLRL